MREGMDMLADAVAGKIHSRTGQTAAAVLHGVRVTETPNAITGASGRASSAASRAARG
jgi:hypothetical protein